MTVEPRGIAARMLRRMPFCGPGASQGMAFTPVCRGQEVLDSFQSLRPAMVVLDARTPGLDLLGCVETLLACAPCRILVIAPLRERATAVEALQRGAMAFLPAPYQDAELTSAIELLLPPVGLVTLQ